MTVDSSTTHAYEIARMNQSVTITKCFRSNHCTCWVPRCELLSLTISRQDHGVQTCEKSETRGKRCYPVSFHLYLGIHRGGVQRNVVSLVGIAVRCYGLVFARVHVYDCVLRVYAERFPWHLAFCVHCRCAGGQNSCASYGFAATGEFIRKRYGALACNLFFGSLARQCVFCNMACLAGPVGRHGRPGTQRSRGEGCLQSPHCNLAHRDPLSGELARPRPPTKSVYTSSRPCQDAYKQY